MLCNLVFLQLPAPYPLVSAPPKPNFPGPHSYFVYVLLATVICGFLNVISLCFTIPALICVTMVNDVIALMILDHDHWPSSTLALKGWWWSFFDIPCIPL